jgi:hypothetical protein
MPATRPAYVAIDVETTGLTPGVDHVYKIALLTFDDEGTDLTRFVSLVLPLIDPLSKRSAPVAMAPSFEAIAGTVLVWLWLAFVVGYNVIFDLAMIDDVPSGAFVFPRTNPHVTSGSSVLQALGSKRTVGDMRLRNGTE